MNLRKLITIVIMVALSIGFLTVGALASEAKVKWTFANPLSMEHPWGIHGQILADLVKERSEGRFVIDYFPSGVLGSEDDVFDQVVAGAVDMMITGPASLQFLYPPIAITQLYYVYRDLDHMNAVMKAPVMQKLFREALEASGVRTLNIWYYGMRQLTTNFPAHTPEDLNNKKIRSQNSAQFRDCINAMGAVATPVDFNELYMALQTGVVDGQENPLPTIKAQKFYEVQDYLILTGHMVHPGNLIVSEKSFQSLPSDLREILIEVSDEVTVLVQEAIVTQEKELIDFLGERMTIITPDVHAFSEKIRTIVLPKYEDVWGKGLYEEIQAVQ